MQIRPLDIFWYGYLSYAKVFNQFFHNKDAPSRKKNRQIKKEHGSEEDSSDEETEEAEAQVQAPQIKAEKADDVPLVQPQVQSIVY